MNTNEHLLGQPAQEAAILKSKSQVKATTSASVSLCVHVWLSLLQRRGSGCPRSSGHEERANARFHFRCLRIPGGFPSHRSFLAAFALILGAAAFSGCASTNLVRVKPWERGTLTDYTMRPDRDPLNTVFAEHIYFSRETATGGRGVGGSGCGCN
jgi:hypothetical protein